MHKSERFKLCKCEIIQNYIANKQIIVYSKGVQERYKKGRKEGNRNANYYYESWSFW